MNNEIKGIVVVGSIVIGLLFSIFGIVSIIEYCRISEKNIYLEQTIEQQKELIEYLRGELNER
jgi:hypothetical protein